MGIRFEIFVVNAAVLAGSPKERKLMRTRITRHRFGIVGVLVLAGVLLFEVPSVSACEKLDTLIRRDDSLSFFLASPISRQENQVRANLSAGRTGSDSIPPGIVVLVPWIYGSDCKPFEWNEPKPWTPPNRVAFYTGALRPPDKWIDKLPTFDVYDAWAQPIYAGDDDKRSTRTKPNLTVEEFLDLYVLVPSFEELEERLGPNKKPGVVERLEAWAAAHPALAKRFPADSLLDYVHRMFQPEPR